MKCTIPGVNLKVFGRAIQSLSKIGDELYFEPQEDGLYLRTVNSCRSAYGCFQFSPTFFSHYVDSQPEKQNSRSTEDSEEEALRCKLGMKSVMTVFRNLSSIDRTVEKCCISLDLKEARLTFLMYCRHGMVKTHNLTFIECETLQAVFSKDLCPNKLTAPPKVLCDAVVNFQSNQEEITLIVQPASVALKNYVEDEPDPKKVIHTELTLSPDEFDNYQVGVDTSITFCLKELRAILAFADVTGLPLSLHFESAGRPVTFSITSDLSFEANLVLATLAEVDSSQMSSSQQTATVSKKSTAKTSRPQAKSDGHRMQPKTSRKQTNSNTNHGLSHPSQTVHHKPQRPTSSSTPAATTDDINMEDGDDEELTRAMMNATETEDAIITDQTLDHSRLTTAVTNNSREPGHVAKQKGSQQVEEGDVEVARVETSKGRSSPTLSSSVTVIRNGEQREEEDFDDLQSFVDKSGLDSTLKELQSQSQSNVKQLSLRSSDSSEQSPIIPLIDQSKSHHSPVQEIEEDDDDDLDDTIPGTPPSKKFRSVFFGTQTSTQPTQSQSKAIILAPNSDDES